MATTRTASTSAALLAAVAGFAATALLFDRAEPTETRPAGSAAASPDSRASRALIENVRTWTVHYRSHAGANRLAHVVLPAWYGPENNPPLPVVISPHGRGATGLSNAAFFDRLPAIGRFALISPDGMGRRLRNFSYGAPGQIDDLAQMPRFAARALPWLRIDDSRIFALGSSMGGQETLLLVSRHPQLLAGAAALDSVTDLARRYGQLPQVPCSRSCVERWGKPYGAVLQSTLAREVGGRPDEAPDGYAARSAISHAREIARSGVPLQIWWSTEDRIVSDQEHQSQALFDELRRIDRCARVSAYVGRWAHSKEMRASELLPIALSGFGLLPADVKELPGSVRYIPAGQCSEREKTT
jgi:pimeloyl-ACP methyl ester carboxylesterase